MSKKIFSGVVSAFLVQAFVAGGLSVGFNAAHADDSQGNFNPKLAKIASQCGAAAQANGTNNIVFRKPGNIGKFWCAVTDREGTLIAVRTSDTNEDGCTQTEFRSDAARLSELIAVAKAWTTSFSNNEVATDSRTVGTASGGQAGASGAYNPGSLWGVWATNLLRTSDRPNGYTCGKRQFGVVPFPGGVPVYDCKGKLIGGAGASGDTVDADDAVTKKAIQLAGLCISPDQTKP